jgi:lactonase
VLRLTPDRQLSTLLSLDQLGPGGIAVHRDGRVTVAAIDFNKGSGAIIAVVPDGSGTRTVVPPEAGYMPNDLAFDAQGGFYFTDFCSTSTEPKGGVYHVSPDVRAIAPVLPHLAMANGVALSPDGRELWAKEFSRNLLHRVELADATTAAPFGTAVPYHFTGPAPDSMRADANGSLYVTTYGQGRVLVLNRNGCSTGTASPSARCCCQGGRRIITSVPPAWPSSPALTSSSL